MTTASAAHSGAVKGAFILGTQTARVAVLAATMAGIGCGGDSSSDDADGLGGVAGRRVFGLRIPPGFPAPQVPDDNRPTEARIQLGRHLFYDVRLSANGTQACASCHHQAKAFTDGRPTPAGSTGELHPRNSPTLTNVGYNATLTWANPGLTKLEHQILIPLFGEHPVELGLTGREQEVLARFANDPDYSARFAEAYPDADPPVQRETVINALASFCRALISGRSRFDQFAYDGDDSALTAQELRGMSLFFSERLECHHCHGGFNFTEASVHEDSVFDATFFHNTGLYNLEGDGGYPPPNTGLHEITGEPDDMGKFRAPTLRNIELTAPYFHDGSAATLEEVIRVYEAGGRNITDGRHAGDGRANPFKSGFVPGFRLGDAEREDLIAFLRSLTDTTFVTDPRLSDPFAEEQP